MSGKSASFSVRFAMFSIILALAAFLLNWLFSFCEVFADDSGQFPTVGTDVSVPIRVIIDAGHGGEDGGASGGCIVEKDVNLEVSYILCDFLRASGLDCIMTRTDDRLLYDEYVHGQLKRRDLAARLKIADENPSALFLSIHMNTFPSAKYSGLQVYYSPNDSESQTLADKIQTYVRTVLQPENTRRIKCAGSDIFLLKRIKSPAVLIECGFLSNAEEAAKLADTVYRRKLAYTIGCSVISYICGA